MALRRLDWNADAAGAPLRHGLKSAFARFFAAGLALATAAGGAAPNGTNINDFRHNNIMAEQMVRSPAEAQTPLQAQAARAVAALKDFIYSGNPQKKDEFTSAYQNAARMNQPQEFADAFAAEMTKQIISDPVIGPALNAYRSAFNGRFYALDFIDFLGTVRDAALSGNTEKLAALRDPSLSSPQFVQNVVEPLITVCKQGQSPEKQMQMQESATEAAGLFLGLLETVRVEPGRKYTMKQQAESRNQAKDISRQMLGQFRANRTADGSFQPGFLDSFDNVLKEQCFQCASLVSGFAADRKTTQGKLTYGDFAELFDRVPKLFSQLLAPGYDYDALSRAYGSELTKAVRSYLILVATPVQDIANLQALERRVAEVEQFVNSRGIGSQQVGTAKKPETLDAIIADWKKRLAANPGREERLALHNEIPGVETLQSIEAMIISGARRARAVLDGNNDFYRTMGTKIWVPRLQTMVTNLKQEADDLMTGKFATALIDKEHIDVNALTDLATAATNANTDITRSLATLDELIRTTPLDKEQARLDAITQMFAKNGQLNKDIDALTDRMSAFYPDTERETLRAQVAERLMVQYVVPVTGMDPVATLRSRYEAMARDKAFISFRNTFTTQIDQYTSSLAATNPSLSGEKMMKQSRQDMATRARTAFQSIPLEYAYGIYDLLRGNYGKNWSGSLTGRDADMAKVCALMTGFSTVPAPYASYLLGRIGRTLVKTYDDASIGVIATAIAASSQMYVNGDYQDLMLAYYNRLPDKLSRLFPEITAMQAQRREQGYDVRIKTPSEDASYRDIFMPAASIRIRLPKRIYEEWTTAGILQVARAPSLVDAAAFSPDFLSVMSTFIEKPMLEGTINLPMPYIALPIILQDIGVLAPDDLPPVGEWISANVNADVTVNNQYNATQTGSTSSSTTTINAAQNFAREGATTTAKQSYSITQSTGGQTDQVGTIDVQNLRLKQNYNVNAFDFNFEQVGSRLQTVGTTFSAVAPKGAETAILFQRDEATPAAAGQQGDVSLTAHIFQRAANGSFILSDAVTLSQDQAQSLYEQAFGRPMQRLYAGGRVQGSNVTAQLDGAVLFSGPWTSGYTSLEQAQGAGAALEVNQWGGYTDYEQTRSGRAAGAFGHFMADKRAFWVGRLTAENVQVEADGQRKFYGEFAYTKADETEMQGFVGFAKNMTSDDLQGMAMADHLFSRDYLGMRYGGVGLGKLITEDQSGRETTGGGRIYGVSSDMLSGLVASTMYRTYAQANQVQGPLTLTPAAQAFYSQNFGLTATLRQMGATDQARQALYQLLTSTNPTDIQAYTNAGITVAPDNTVTMGTNSSQWLQTYVKQQATSQQTLQAQTTQMLVSAGVRQAISSQLNLETGAGWDILSNSGAAMLNFDWTPLSDVVSDVGLRAYFMTQDQSVIPIIGGTAGFVPLPRTKLIGEAYYPGIGELRLRTPAFELALGGGEIKDVAGGAHLGIRIPLGEWWSLGAATSLSSDNLKAESKRLDQQEGITGLVFTMPYSDKPGFRLANVFGSISFIHQNEELFAVANGSAFEWDATAGLNWLTARSSLSGRLGTQYWEATTPEGLHSMYSLTAGTSYTIRTLKGSGKLMLINPALSADLSVGTEEVQTATSSSSMLNLRLNFKASTEF